MTDKHTAAAAASGNTQKNPDDWVTGDEPMTGAQRSYLKTLSEEAKAPFDDTLTKAQASIRIEELQHITGRGERQAPDAGEEDPGAAEGDPATHAAMKGEADKTGKADTDRAIEQEDAALKNVRDGYTSQRTAAL